MAGSSSDKREGIDLGLSALLTSVQAPSPSEEPPQTQPSPAPAEAASRTSPFEELLAGKRWEEMIALSESALSASGSPVSLLWWIRGHLGALSMPVSLLMSPFEQAVRQLSAGQPSPEELRLLADTGSLMLERLQQVGDRAQVEAFQKLLQENHIGQLHGTLGKHRHSWTLSAKAPEKQEYALQGAPGPGTPSAARRRLRAPLLLALLLLLLMLGGSLALLAAKTGFLSVPKALAREPYLREQGALEQEAPAISPRDPVGDLSALYYSIESATPAPQQNEAAEPAVRAPADADAPNRRKEQINTNGPLENEEYRRGADRRADGGGPGAGLPTQPSLPGGRGPPTPFDRQVEAHKYRVLVPTDVVASPSYVAQVLGRLRAGDIVLVESRAGSWLKLRSRRGNPGYILAQDAVRADNSQIDAQP